MLLVFILSTFFPTAEKEYELSVNFEYLGFLFEDPNYMVSGGISQMVLLPDKKTVKYVIQTVQVNEEMYLFMREQGTKCELVSNDHHHVVELCSLEDEVKYNINMRTKFLFMDIGEDHFFVSLSASVENFVKYENEINKVYETIKIENVPVK